MAALLVHGFAKVEILVSTRDEHVHGARSVIHGWRASERPSMKVFVSYAKDDGDAVNEIARVLNGAGYDLQLGLRDLESAVSSSSSSGKLGIVSARTCRPRIPSLCSRNRFSRRSRRRFRNW
jgi:hypothetical protein